jgi:hypothetical protein
MLRKTITSEREVREFARILANKIFTYEGTVWKRCGLGGKRLGDSSSHIVPSFELRLQVREESIEHHLRDAVNQ